jgi:hypothetical protein
MPVSQSVERCIGVEGALQQPPARSDEDRELAERLVAEAAEQGPELVGRDGVLTRLTKRCWRPVSKLS